MNREHLIRRYEHNYFRAWVVSTKRRGKRFVRYFSDQPRGRVAALPCRRQVSKLMPNRSHAALISASGIAARLTARALLIATSPAWLDTLAVASWLCAPLSAPTETHKPPPHVADVEAVPDHRVPMQYVPATLR